MNYDPRRSIARLAAAVMAADAHITSSEIASLAGLVRLGLGTLEAITREELLRSAHEPIDVRAACTELAAAHPDAGPFVLAALAEIAASDGTIEAREADLLANIASFLGVPPAVASEIVRAAADSAGSVDDGEASIATAASADAPPPACEPRTARVAAAAPSAGTSAPPCRGDGLAAYAALGLQPGASRGSVEEAYRAVIERYQPVKVIDFGPEFAALAVRRLADATEAFAAIAAGQGV